jgi:protein SCO1/2
MIASVLAAIAAGIGAAAVLGQRHPVELRSGTALPEPRPIGKFELVDQHGRAFNRDSLEGRWSLVFSGFTNCPDICPTTLAQLAELGERLPAGAVQRVFVSVDPERDTPERLATYLAHFDAGLAGATGTRTEIERLTRELGLAHVRNPGVDGDYTVDHSTALVLIDPRARVAGYFQPPHDSAALAADLAALTSGAG